MIIYSFFEEKKNANKIHIHMAIMKIFEKILQVEQLEGLNKKNADG